MKSYGSGSRRLVAWMGLILLFGCSSRSVREEPPEMRVAVAECDAFVAAMDRCIGGVAGGGQQVTAMRASLVPSPTATEHDAQNLKKRCAESRAQLAKACK